MYTKLIHIQMMKKLMMMMMAGVMKLQVRFQIHTMRKIIYFIFILLMLNHQQGKSENFSYCIRIFQKLIISNVHYRNNGGRKNFSFSNEKVREIERSNRILLQKILSKGPIGIVPKQKTITFPKVYFKNSMI